MADVRVLEELNVFTPLGIRFWDPALDLQIRDSLQVTARRSTGSGRRVRAFRTASDVYAFNGLPGLLSLEYPSSGQTEETSPPPTHPFVIEVRDTRRRFLDVAFGIELPLPYRGVFLNGTIPGSPEISPSGFHLYSASTRPLDRTYAAVRGELAEVESRAPAAHAVVQVQVPDGQTWFGIADGSGRFLVVMPWPSVLPGFGGSPFNPGRKSLFEQIWGIRVGIMYEPGRQKPLSRSTIPDYLSILEQRRAHIWDQQPDDGGIAAPDWFGELQFGTEMVLKTQGLSKLLVSPAVSSP